MIRSYLVTIHWAYLCLHMNDAQIWQSFFRTLAQHLDDFSSSELITMLCARIQHNRFYNANANTMDKLTHRLIIQWLQPYLTINTGFTNLRVFMPIRLFCFF